MPPNTLYHVFSYLEQNSAAWSILLRGKMQKIYRISIIMTSYKECGKPTGDFKWAEVCPSWTVIHKFLRLKPDLKKARLSAPGGNSHFSISLFDKKNMLDVLF